MDYLENVKEVGTVTTRLLRATGRALGACGMILQSFARFLEVSHYTLASVRQILEYAGILPKQAVRSFDTMSLILYIFEMSLRAVGQMARYVSSPSRLKQSHIDTMHEVGNLFNGCIQSMNPGSDQCHHFKNVSVRELTIFYRAYDDI